MKHSPHSSFPLRGNRGSAFITVLIFTLILSLLMASILGWSLTERRLNVYNSYLLEARNAAEALAEYGAAQIQTNFNSYSTPPSLNPSGNTALSTQGLDTFFSGSYVVTSPYSDSNPTGLRLIGGAPQDIPTGGALYYINPSDPANANDTLKGQYTTRRDIQILAQATVAPPIGNPITAYVTETISVRGSPLFANAVFYSNNDLEAAPGPSFDIYGPVHVNGNMFPTAQGTVETQTANSVNFHGPVSITGNLYHAWANVNPAADGRGYSSSASNMNGEPLGNDPVTFVNSAGTQVNLQGAKNIWDDSTMGGLSSLLTSSGLYSNTSTAALTQLTATVSSNFRTYASQTWNGNLQTSAMGVQSYNPISFSEPIDANGDLPDPHSLIDPPQIPSATTTTNGVSGPNPYYTALQQVETQKLSNQAGLYALVTVTPGVNGAADTAAITLYGPAGTGTTAANTGPNGGILLGTVPTGLISFIPYTATNTGTASATATQTSYSVTGSGSAYYVTTTTKKNGTLTQTVTNTYNGTSSSPSVTTTNTFTGGSSSTSNSTKYASSALAQNAITSQGLTTTTNIPPPTATPSGNLTVSSGLYDSRQLAGVNLVQIDMSALSSALADTNSGTNNKYAIVNTDNSVWGSGDTGWNGGVYVDVESSSGGTFPGQTSIVVANGQVTSGKSLLPTVNNVPGLMLATNAPMYVAGNFNADGSGAASSISATTPDDGKTNAPGGATSAEVPVALAADAITILSGNYFGTANNTIGSSASATNSSSTSAYKSASTTEPTASGSVEIAAAFITGIVSTTNSTFSGGVNNLPRFIENWGSNSVAIRGSLTSLYSSKVAIGPWAQRYYSAPKRVWGFDQIFSNGTFPPITPKVISYRRVAFTNTVTTYDQNGNPVFTPFNAANFKTAVSNLLSEF